MINFPPQSVLELSTPPTPAGALGSCWARPVVEFLQPSLTLGFVWKNDAARRQLPSTAWWFCLWRSGMAGRGSCKAVLGPRCPQALKEGQGAREPPHGSELVLGAGSNGPGAEHNGSHMPAPWGALCLSPPWSHAELCAQGQISMLRGLCSVRVFQTEFTPPLPG